MRPRAVKERIGDPRPGLRASLGQDVTGELQLQGGLPLPGGGPKGCEDLVGPYAAIGHGPSHRHDGPVEHQFEIAEIRQEPRSHGMDADEGENGDEHDRWEVEDRLARRPGRG
jgi:hypothetical protein